MYEPLGHWEMNMKAIESSLHRLAFLISRLFLLGKRTIGENELDSVPASHHLFLNATMILVG